MEVCEEVLQGDLSVNFFRVSEILDPGISADSKYELCRLPSRFLVRCKVSALRFVRRLIAHTDDGRSVVVDRFIISPNSCGSANASP